MGERGLRGPADTGNRTEVYRACASRYTGSGSVKKPPERTLLRLLHHNWNVRMLRSVSFVVERFLLKGCFSSVEIIGLEEVRRKAKAGRRLIFIPDHQSEYDWLLLQSRLFLAGVRTVIQAGDNLFVGPLDPILRGCGAFMSIREQRAFYSSHWLHNLFMKFLGKRPIVITREMYSRLYIKQLKRILGKEDFNLLVFPGYETDPYSGRVKYGRSYSGEFNPLSPHVFITVNRALRELGIRQAEYIPVSVAYERVPEDVLFREFKAATRRTKIAKYIYDLYYTFFKAPFSKELHQEKSRVCVRFGEGIPVDFSARAKDFAERIRFEIGKLTRVYESTLIFRSVNDKFALPKEELKANILENVRKLRSMRVDCSPLYSSSNKLFSIDRMLRRVESIFNFPKSPVVPLKSYLTLEHDQNEVFIHNPHLAAYYANKLKYLLSKWRAGRHPSNNSAGAPSALPVQEKQPSLRR
jgi:hypothetical protein